MKKRINPTDEVYLTQTEVKSIEKALKNPEFHKYWDEYLDELTDPAGRKEREEYMLEQEKHNDLPPNTHLVRPEALMCLKTYTRRLLSNQGVRKYIDQKLFINVCTSPHMDPPEKVEVVQNGQKMQSWSLPYTLSKPRPAKDNKGEICMAVDIIFNSKCKASVQFEEFRKMLCDTAVDAVNTLIKEYNEKASQNYKLLKKLKYKGGVPEFILMKKRGKTEGKSALSENLKADSHMPEVMKDILKEKEKAAAGGNPSKPKEEKVDEDSTLDVDITASEAIKEQKKAKKSKKIKAHNEAPKYTITESHTADMSECFDGPSTAPKPLKKVPNVLVIKVELPGVRSTKDAKLELQEKRLKFQYLDHYVLDIPLPYVVNEKSAKAKYDKDKEMLVLEVEVDKSKTNAKATEDDKKIVDLTGLKKTAAAAKTEKAEEDVEVEKIEIPSLFNIYKPPTTEGAKKTAAAKDQRPEDEPPKMDIRYKDDPESDPLSATGNFVAMQSAQGAAEKPKTLITEVPAQAKKVEPVPTPQPVDPATAPIVEGKYDFKQLGEYVFLTYKVKGYQKPHVVHKVTDNEMLLEVYDPTLNARQRTCVTLFLPIVSKESSVELLTDYICVKLKKADPSKLWDSLGYAISQLTEATTEPMVAAVPVSDSATKEPAATANAKESAPPAENRQNEMEKAEDALEQEQEKKITPQYVHLKSDMIFAIY